MEVDMITLLLAMITNAVTSTHVIPLYLDTPLAFEITVPPSWGYSDKSFSVSHYRDVLLCSNNLGDDSLRLENWRENLSEGNWRESYGPKAFEMQLVPGTVYADLAMWTDPFSGKPTYAWTQEEGPNTRVRQAAQNRKAQWETDGIVVYSFRFARWGWPWEGLIAARKPFSGDDLDKAFAIFETLNFSDEPVVDPHQAVEVAIPYLPETMRPKSEWFESGLSSHYRIETQTMGESFRVTFMVLDGTEARKVVRSTICTVDRNGTVSVSKPEAK